MAFNTRWKRVKSIPKVFDKTKLVEDYGYVPTAERIKQLMLAGERLRTARAVEYDTLDLPVSDTDGIPNTIYKPDLFDGQKMMERRAYRAEERRSRLKAQSARPDPVATPSDLATAALQAAPPPPATPNTAN